MSFQKKLVLSFALIGHICALIKLHLQVDDFDNLYFTSWFNDDCKINITLTDQYCNTLQLLKTPDNAKCYSDSKGDHTGLFLFSGFESTLTYSEALNNSFLCVGYKKNDSSNTTFSELVSQRLAAGKKIFINIYRDDQTDYYDAIGAASIGYPSYSIVKDGEKLVLLKKDYFFEDKYAVIITGFKYFGKQLDSKSVVFTLDSFHGFTKQAFLQLIQIFEQNRIPYTFERNEDLQDYRVYFPSTRYLQPIELSLLTVDNIIYPLTIQVSQYTKKIAKGKYQLAIKALFNTDHMTLSYNVCQDYYVGLDQSNGTVQIGIKGSDVLY